MRKLIAGVAIVVGVLALGACNTDHTQLNDAPVGKIDDSPAFVITNPDLFPNIAIHCYGHNGLYATTRTASDALTIVVNDPQCGGTGPSQVNEK